MSRALRYDGSMNGELADVVFLHWKNILVIAGEVAITHTPLCKQDTLPALPASSLAAL